jgi:hypothetical protein
MLTAIVVAIVTRLASNAFIIQTGSILSGIVNE